MAWLERFLGEYKGTVLAVTHDRYFLENIAGYIVEIDRGDFFPFRGNYTEWLVAKQRRIEMEVKQERAREKLLSKELEWLNTSQKARQAKSKARVNKYFQLMEQVRKSNYMPGAIVIPKGPRLPSVVLEVSNLTKVIEDETEFGKRKRTLFRNLSFSVPPGAVVGIVGPNGAGKVSQIFSSYFPSFFPRNKFLSPLKKDDTLQDTHFHGREEVEGEQGKQWKDKNRR